MAGTINVSRDIWDDPAFKDAEMTQREALIWLIAKASWKSRVVRIGSQEIETARGQLAVSTRFLAKAWMWNEARVRRYLNMLENRRTLRRETDAGVSLITICNYDKYQWLHEASDAGATQQVTQQRRTADAKHNKDVIRVKEGDKRYSVKSDNEISEEQNSFALMDPSFLSKEAENKDIPDEAFETFWKAYPKKVGKPSAKKNFARALRAGADAEAIIAGARAYAARMQGKEATYLKHPQGWLSDERWNDEKRIEASDPNAGLSQGQIELREKIRRMGKPNA